VQKLRHDNPCDPDGPIANDTTVAGEMFAASVPSDLRCAHRGACPFGVVLESRQGQIPDLQAVADEFPKTRCLCVRPSSQGPRLGRAGAVMKIGLNDARYAYYAKRMGRWAGSALVTRFVQSLAVNCGRAGPAYV